MSPTSATNRSTNPRMMQSEKITEGPIGVGTRFRATARSGRRVVEMLIEVTECERARRFGSRTVMPSVDVNGGLTFEPIDGATRMSWSWEVSPRGPLRVLGPWSPALGAGNERPGPGSRPSWKDPALPATQQSSDQNRSSTGMAWTAARSVPGLRNDHGQIPSLGGGRWSCSADPHQEKWMKLKTQLLAKAIPGGRYFCYLAGNADYIIQTGGFQQDALQCLAASQPRQAVGFRRPQHHQAVIEA
jgi:hypothetical protein